MNLTNDPLNDPLKWDKMRELLGLIDARGHPASPNNYYSIRSLEQQWKISPQHPHSPY